MNNPEGQLQQASGVAFETKDPGKYVVTFQNSHTIGSYWIVALGDIQKGEKLYPWTMISSPFQLSLFILARDPRTFHEKYHDEVMRIVKEKGFTKEINKPLETYQGDDCLYPPTPRLPEFGYE